MSMITDILAPAGISPDKCEKFERFAELLKEANSRFNLTRITDDESMARLHFLDSIAPAMKGLIEGTERVIDIGTGGGFPSVPLAIYCEGLSITAVEASEKKLSFVKEVSDVLGLGIECVCVRAEELAHTERRESYDVCVSRAVASLNTLLELTAPFVKPGGRILCYKGQSCAEEIELARNAQKLLSLCEPELYVSGLEGTEHVIAAYVKRAALDKKYPRRFSRIKASPL